MRSIKEQLLSILDIIKTIGLQINNLNDISTLQSKQIELLGKRIDLLEGKKEPSEGINPH